jgi:hypothetical protein
MPFDGLPMRSSWPPCVAAEVVQKAPELGLVASQLAGGLPAAGAAAASKLRVTALDSGTYPMDGGGVATCRQVVLDGLPDVQWSVQAELANDLKQVDYIIV